MTAQTQPPSPAQPQTFAQFLGLLLRGFVKGLPLKLLLAGGMAFLAWIVHTYLLVVSNEGFNPGQSTFLDMILALRDRITPSAFFWALLSAMITAIIVRTITWGPAKTVRQVVETPGWLWQAGKQSGALLWPLLFLGGAALALLIGTIIGHRLNNLLLSFLFLGMVIARQNSPVLLGLRLAWSDIQRAFRRPSATPFSLDGAGLFAAGVVVGFFFSAIQFFPPWGGCIGIFLLLAAMIALVAWAKYRPDMAKVAVWFVVFGLLALWVSPVFADDGGWQEAGGTLSGWISSPGAARAVGMGILPAMSVAVGVLLGFFFGGAVKTISQAGMTLDPSPAGGQAPKTGSTPPPPPPTGQQPKVGTDALAGQQPKPGTGDPPPLAVRGQAAKQPAPGLESQPAGQDIPTQIIRQPEGQAPKAPDPAGFESSPTTPVEPTSATGQELPTQMTRPPEGQAPKTPDAIVDSAGEPGGIDPQPAARVDTGPEGSTPAVRSTEGQAPKEIDLTTKEPAPSARIDTGPEGSTPAVRSAEGQAPKEIDLTTQEPAPSARVDTGPEGSTPVVRSTEGQAPKEIDLAAQEPGPTARVDTGPEGSTPAVRSIEGQAPKEAGVIDKPATPMAKAATGTPAEGSTPVAREGTDPLASQSQARPEADPITRTAKDASAAKVAAEQPSSSAIRPESSDPDPPGVEVADINTGEGAAPIIPAAVGALAPVTGPDAGWYLEVIKGAQLGQRFPLGELAQLGRSPDIEIPLNDGKASRVHARLERQGDIYRLTDLDSTNGTFVNAYRINRPVFLQPDDTIRIGDTQLQIKNK